MRFAADYLFKDTVCDTADEFNIRYSNKKNSYEKLIEFVEEYPDKRINVECYDKRDIEQMRTLSKLSDGRVYVRLSKDTLSLVGDVKEVGVPFFFSYDYSASSKCMLDSLLSVGVSDVYISDDLWYSLKETSDACHAVGTSVRVVLNRIPMTTPGCGKDVRSIIIRPEDVPSIEGLVDTAEFFIEDFMSERGALSVLKSAYLDKHSWYGDLMEINKDLSIKFECPILPSGLFKSKIMCGRSCSFGSGCTRCKQMYEVGDVLKESVLKLKSS